MSVKRMDFARISAMALASSRTLLAQWLPNGKWQGREYSVGDLSGSEGDSLKINADSGLWSDFATGESGSDLISLFAAMNSLSQREAAEELAIALAIPSEAAGSHPAKRDESASGKRKGQKWMAIIPAPARTLKFTGRHFHYGDPIAIWTYHDQRGALIGYVCRYIDSNGEKVVMPWCWARTKDGAEAWRPLSFLKPRPLYGLELIADSGTAQVLIVEGEKACDAARRLFPDWLVLTWPGGSKAVKHANWAPLAGANVAIWPDADDAGHQAASELSQLLRGIAATIQTVRPPDGVVAGWDLADAEQEGWTADRAAQHLADNLQAPPDLGRTSLAVSRSARVTVSEDGTAWSKALIRKNNGQPEECWQNVSSILELHPQWQGVLAWDEFATRVATRRMPPINGGSVGSWSETSDLELGMWLARKTGLLVRDVGHIAKGIRHHVSNHAFHPVREYFDSLEHDGRPRLDSFFGDYLSSPSPAPYAKLTSVFFFSGWSLGSTNPAASCAWFPCSRARSSAGNPRRLPPSAAIGSAIRPSSWATKTRTWRSRASFCMRSPSSTPSTGPRRPA